MHDLDMTRIGSGSSARPLLSEGTAALRLRLQRIAGIRLHGGYTAAKKAEGPDDYPSQLFDLLVAGTRNPTQKRIRIK